MGDFVHLHNHSHFSLQDGACTIDGLVSSALKYEQHAVALTDHGVMYGISEFTKKAKSAGIKPIVGMEAYIVMDGSRHDRGKQDSINGKRYRKYNHLVLLAKNRKGYDNLIKLSTIGFTEGFYYKPRIDIEVLRQYHEGIICTTACPAGPISSLLINDEYDKAKERAVLFQEIFGDDFYLEIQDHGIDVETCARRNAETIERIGY
jgi:DNA polymerase-3 subunit alpha